MSQGVRCDVLGGDARAVDRGAGSVFGDHLGDRVPREWLASAGGEQCVVRPAVVVGQPNTECGNGLSGQGRGSVFAARTATAPPTPKPHAVLQTPAEPEQVAS